VTDCSICGGLGWVCESHPMLPMDHDPACGMGMPCGCNPHAAVRWDELYASAKRDDDQVQ
jgi:hypothetical protein